MKHNTTQQHFLNEVVETPRFCSVTFVTNSGKITKLHGRVGVKKYLKGIGKRSLETDSTYILFYDLHKGYRNVRRDTILAVNGLNLKVEAR